MTDSPIDNFAPRLLAWFDVSGRHDLPWQHPRTPYRVWLSEIMLQQTQVKTAAPYFERFVTALPTLRDLSNAPLDDVLALWSGLGYYARARNLHAAAKRCVELHGGELPRDVEALTALPGIGRSTAAAIASQAWNDRHAILDGNVKRVLSRYHGIEGYPGLPAIEKRMWALAERHVANPQLPGSRMADYTQAQMDLGATLCTRADPACVLCPLQDDCVARREGRTAELPTPKPGKTPPQRFAHVLWAEDARGRILMQRRPPTGIWASLWTLPQADDSALAREWFERHLSGEYEQAQPLSPIDHAFSHYKLQLQPLRWRGAESRARIGDNDDLRWVAREELASLGIPAPIRKLLETPSDA
ncbi:A/G-specific adenine glycosylase [Lysobacter sp.]|uniref:A/G-specific adenine glycosylase n=1 Tax=Lysobacter sp. TaxID=72226 RepID=UPI002D73E5AE|nr:A/G-specific adenine glycosylase [Lysobacter sp.]HZX76273.1 A/G-specific adenine glycosylase [Lysobacter sp.]